MAQELVQGSDGSFAIVDDQTGNRGLDVRPNTRVLSTLLFSISQTTPGSVIGSGADARVRLPGGAIPVRLRYFGRANDAVTAASITIGLNNITSNHFLSSQNVANAPTGLGQQTPAGVTNLYAALPTLPVGQFHNIVGFYSVAGTSTSGGPWYVEMDYYLPSPA